jgi:hypothetical protein
MRSGPAPGFAFPADLNPHPLNGTRPVSADSSATPTTAAVAPVPERAAAAILGSMIALILVLMGILVQTTWVNPASASDVAPAEAADYAQR